VPHGVLVFVIPYEQVLDCLKLLSDHFTRLTVMRLSDEEAKRFRQVVVLGERVHVRSAQIEENRRQLSETVLHGGYEMLPSLSERASAVYRVPPFSGAEVIYRGLPYNEIEDLLPGEDDPWWPLLSQEPVAASLPVPHLVEPTPKRQQKPSPLWPTGYAEDEQMLLFA
jgi:hypothetical protein